MFSNKTTKLFLVTTAHCWWWGFATTLFQLAICQIILSRTCLLVSYQFDRQHDFAR